MKQRNPSEIDDTEDRMGSVRELEFDEHPEGRIGDERPPREVRDQFPPERAADMGMSGGETLRDGEYEDNVSRDDLAPETLLDEGTESDLEPRDDSPADRDLSVVAEADIGGGIGLDEAELARSNPLDGKPWSDQVADPDSARNQED